MHYSKHSTTVLHIHNPHPIKLGTSLNVSMRYWYDGTYSAVTGWHQYCIVNVKDCNTYLYIFTSKSFDPDTVPLKWDNCFMVIWCFTKMRLIVEMLSRSMLLNTSLSASICCCSLLRRIALFARTRSTMASFCCWVNRGWRPPPEGLLVIL